MSIKGVLIVLSLVTALPAVLSVTFLEFFEGVHLYYTTDNVYAFSPLGLDGKKVPLSKFDGHPMVIVNLPFQINPEFVSSLNQLTESFSYINLEVLAFPTNEFSLLKGFDQPIVIKKWIKDTSIKFRVFDTVDVNGFYSEPLWMYLKAFFNFNDDITEDYTMFTVDSNGCPVKRYNGILHPPEELSLFDFMGKYEDDYFGVA